MPEVMEPDPTVLMLAGDWHGNKTWAERVIGHAAGHDVDTIVQLGDFGYWLDDYRTEDYLGAIDSMLTMADIRLFWLDGNHEDHSRVAEWSNETRHAKVRYLPRGFRWQWWDRTWMSVGGAMSVDKRFRVEGESWWPAEELTDSDVDHAAREGEVDVILSHDCPRGVDIPGVGPDTKGGVRGDWPADILAEAQAHRDKLATICRATAPGWLFHGHYHIRHDGKLDETRVVGLADDRSEMGEHVLMLTRDDL